MLRRLVVGLEGDLVLEDHGEAVGEALGAGGKVDAEVNRLDDSWELFLEVGDSLEDVVGLVLGDRGLELDEDDVCDGHFCYCCEGVFGG